MAGRAKRQREKEELRQELEQYKDGIIPCVSEEVMDRGEEYAAKCVLDLAESEFVRMSEYYYYFAHQRSHYDSLSILEIEKQDEQGNKRTDYAFGHISERDLKDPEKRKFICDVLLSDYHLKKVYSKGQGVLEKVDKYIPKIELEMPESSRRDIPTLFSLSNLLYDKERKAMFLFTHEANGIVYDARGTKLSDPLDMKRYYNNATIKTVDELLDTEKERTMDE